MTTKTLESTNPHSTRVLTVTDIDGKIVGLDIEDVSDDLTINVKRAELLDALGLGKEFIAKLEAVESLLVRALNAPGVPGDAHEDTANAHERVLSIIKAVSA